MVNEKRKKFWLYVLYLEHDRWCIGITTKHPELRFLEHRNNIRSAAWTRAHKPIELYDFIDLGLVREEQAKSRENNATIEYMRRYGINNVRGGDYTEVEDYVIKGKHFFRKDTWEMFKYGATGIFVMYLFVLAAVLLGTR